MVSTRSGAITAPWPMRRVPRIWAVKASGGTMALSATVDERVHSRSKGKSSALGWSCWETLHSSKASVIPNPVRCQRYSHLALPTAVGKRLGRSPHRLVGLGDTGFNGGVHGAQQGGRLDRLLDHRVHAGVQVFGRVP